MKIYTKTGDKGDTGLFGGQRVVKDSLRIDAYGTVDELSSLIGVCRSAIAMKEVDLILEEIQNDLFTLGADLATPITSSSASVRRIQPSDSTRLEVHIDHIERQIEPLKSFILPGGNQGAALLHFSRTVCRRGERLVVRLAREEKIGDQPVIYLNRLSDLLFMMGRWVNALTSTSETKWKS